jgi:mono/diheme cytochrome c family protein
MSRIRLVAGLITVLALGSAAHAISSTTPAAHSKPASKSTVTAAAGKTDAETKAQLIARGKHLVTVSGCNDCHTPGALYGAPDFARLLSGSEVGWQGPWGTSYARNLTPDPETGLGDYSAKEIVAAMKSGRRLDGKPMLPPMPWQGIASNGDDDLYAIAAYLLSLPIVVHAVPASLPPGQQATGPVIVLPAPSAWDAPRATPAGADSKESH